jgi:pimeloyl-ACP methyl ester carboxylesterase
MSITTKAPRKSAIIAGSTMTYVDVGEGTPVVLGHSYLWDADMWAPQIAALSQRYRVIVPDLWGHGDSGALPPYTATMSEISNHHLQLLDSLGIDNFALVGLSVGGMWATELALSVSERVTALCLINTFVGAEPAETRALFFSLLDTVAALGAVPHAMVDKLAPMFFGPDTFANRPEMVDAFRSQLTGVDRRALLETLVPLGRMIFGRRNAMPDLGRIAAPALVLTGEHDRSRPPAEGREMAAALNCDFVELPGAGHISSLETPEVLNRQLTAFLDGALA